MFHVKSWLRISLDRKFALNCSCTLYSVHIPFSVLQVPSPATLLQRGLGLSADMYQIPPQATRMQAWGFFAAQINRTKTASQPMSDLIFYASSLKQSRRSNRPEERRLRWSEPIQTESSKKLSTDCHGVEARTDIGHLITVLGFLGQAFFTPSKPLVTSS